MRWGGGSLRRNHEAGFASSRSRNWDSSGARIGAERSVPLDVRVYFAAHAVAETRCKLAPGRKPHFSVDELQRLVGRVKPASLKSAVARLERRGLLRFQPSAITFADTATGFEPALSAVVSAFLVDFRQPRRAIPVPRHTLTLLAGRSGRAWTATVLAELVRRLRWVGGRAGERGVVASGLCKASWVSRAFGVSLRGVKSARAELAARGWLEREDAPQWALNRWGSRGRLNLDFSVSATGNGTRTAETDSAPPSASNSTASAPPDIKAGPSTRYLKNQNPKRPAAPTPPDHPPACGRQRGFLRKGRAKTLGHGGIDATTSLHIEPEDLTDTARLHRIFEVAHAAGLARPGESGFRDIVALAERARRVATTNPCGLFAALVRAKRYAFIANDDEDRASRRVKEFFYGADGPRTSQLEGDEVESEEARRRELQRQVAALRNRTAA